MLKTHGIKTPGFAANAALDQKESGIRIEKESKEIGGATEHLE